MYVNTESRHRSMSTNSFLHFRPTPLIRWKCNPILINTLHKKATQTQRNNDVAATWTRHCAHQLQTARVLFCEYVVVIWGKKSSERIHDSFVNWLPFGLHTAFQFCSISCDILRFVFFFFFQSKFTKFDCNFTWSGKIEKMLSNLPDANKWPINYYLVEWVKSFCLQINFDSLFSVLLSFCGLLLLVYSHSQLNIFTSHAHNSRPIESLLNFAKLTFAFNFILAQTIVFVFRFFPQNLCECVQQRFTTGYERIKWLQNNYGWLSTTYCTHTLKPPPILAATVPVTLCACTNGVWIYSNHRRHDRKKQKVRTHTAACHCAGHAQVAIFEQAYTWKFMVSDVMFGEMDLIGEGILPHIKFNIHVHRWAITQAQQE